MFLAFVMSTGALFAEPPGSKATPFGEPGNIIPSGIVAINPDTGAITTNHPEVKKMVYPEKDHVSKIQAKLFPKGDPNINPWQDAVWYEMVCPPPPPVFLALTVKQPEGTETTRHIWGPDMPLGVLNALLSGAVGGDGKAIDGVNSLEERAQREADQNKKAELEKCKAYVKANIVWSDSLKQQELRKKLSKETQKRGALEGWSPLLDATVGKPEQVDRQQGGVKGRPDNVPQVIIENGKKQDRIMCPTTQKEIEDIEKAMARDWQDWKEGGAAKKPKNNKGENPYGDGVKTSQDLYDLLQRFKAKCGTVPTSDGDQQKDRDGTEDTLDENIDVKENVRGGKNLYQDASPKKTVQTPSGNVDTISVKDFGKKNLSMIAEIQKEFEKIKEFGYAGSDSQPKVGFGSLGRQIYNLLRSLFENSNNFTTRSLAWEYQLLKEQLFGRDLTGDAIVTPWGGGGETINQLVEQLEDYVNGQGTAELKKRFDHRDIEDVEALLNALKDIVSKLKAKFYLITPGSGELAGTL